ncbi:hypothetical protein PLESTB_001543100 [Pleodorina starrii]|uniref:Uncharacterized protein n=1 Tax=Pleodorina starrii TaxID=330485 RepID=A0A9W6BXV3_9CHLO|nr:hypothetical protein PLESTM_002000300 [Pleodorina starrii]GLC59855.1 hypothetical protein PLESTB_001543100 [Pleodorina starrii]
MQQQQRPRRQQQAQARFSAEAEALAAAAAATAALVGAGVVVDRTLACRGLRGGATRRACAWRLCVDPRDAAWFFGGKACNAFSVTRSALILLASFLQSARP